MTSILKTLRNHWKKSTLAAVLLTYGAGMIKDKIRTNNMMRVYCEEAKKFGEEIISQTGKPRHITVILNPAARDGKGKKLYENYCSPLLNLAGIRVSTITTEHEGQARDLMEIMENTDAVIIAGGDGTLHEAITGLLRRNDEASATRRIPIGLAPIGRKNALAKSLYSEKYESEAQFLACTTMAVIHQVIQPVDVMKVQGQNNKPVFSLTQLDYGAFRNVDSIIQKYWYYGSFKSQMAYFFSAIKGLPETIDLDLSYVNHCNGCSKCFIKKEKIILNATKTSGGKWWSPFVPKIPNHASNDGTEIEPDFSNVINEECGNRHSKQISCSNLSFSINLLKETGGIAVNIQNPLTSRPQFIEEGWSHCKTNNIPNNSQNEPLSIGEGKIEIILPEGEEKWFSIDNENYEAQNVELTYMPLKVLMFVEKKIQQ